MSKASFRMYDYSLRMLQTYLDRIGVVEIKELSPPILSSFVIDSKDRFGKASLIRVLSPIRVMLRYLYRERILERDLSSVVELPHTYELANLPRSISWDEVRRMLEVVDLRTPVGRRDYAILLLIVTYGLRAREIAAIKLDDIDWKNERLLVKARKAGHSTGYPLSAVVGNAILDYLKNDRPETRERSLFICINAPKVPMSYASVSGRALHYLRLAGIDIPKRGSHTLRHTCVQRLVDAQFPLKAIGDYIGHKSPSSTRVYAKVDIESLRQLALGLGEDLS
ncbi:MAG: tyrosine-type recombinase/integrase [Candidatus Obscuribacterales bacterium]|nr:tyrosine-type recombinase/integrase [Candidatus Obscuribacterales bacterium]